MEKPTPTPHPSTTAEPAPSPSPSPRPSLLSRRLAHLQRPLQPMISVTTHTVHAAFPATLLHYHLLSSPQLDALGEHYHQSSPKLESWCYPNSVAARWRVVNPFTESLADPLVDALINSHATTNDDDDDNDDNDDDDTTPPTDAPDSTIDPVVAAIIGLQPPQPAQPSAKASVHDRRRRFGRFIGLRGCESPGLSRDEARKQDQAAMDAWVEGEVRRKVRRMRGVGAKSLFRD